MKSINRCRRGFTLLELILALSMAAMLALTLFRAMDVALKAKRSAMATIEPTRAASIAADLIRQDLESILPPTGTFAGPFEALHQPGANGDEDTVQFFSIGADTPMQDSPLSEGIRRVELLVRTDVSPPTLVRRVTRNLMPTIDPPVEEEILCRDVRSFSLKYFDGTTWQDSWDSTLVENVLPVAVAMTIEMNNPNGSPQEPPAHVSRVVPLACGTANAFTGAFP